MRTAHAAPWLAAIASAALLACALPAQDLAPLQAGDLTIWVLQPAPPTPLSKALQIAALHHATPLTYTEHEAGSFGQSASTYGTDSSTYGAPSDTSAISAPPAGTGYHEQPSGSFGQTSSTYGTASSNYGQTAASLGQTAGNYGVDSSNDGRDPAAFGSSLGALAQAGNPAANSPQNTTLQQTPQLMRFERSVHSAFLELRVRYVSIDPGELEAQLAAVRGTARYPDLLLAPDLPASTYPASWWTGVERDFGIAMLQPASFLADGVTQSPPATPPLAILSRAPHMAAARAFALWLSEAGSGCDGCVLENLSQDQQAAATLASSAVARLLHGDSLGAEADPEMAPLPPNDAQSMLVAAAGPASAATPIRVQVIHASVHGRLAAIALRAIASSASVFEIAHPLVVLRKDGEGRWRVLHVSLNLPFVEQQRERETLSNSIALASGRDVLPKGITQASPSNGDTRPPQPILWWDNRGGATLQVIEWQVSEGSFWSAPHLYLAPDVGSRLRTEVDARFAATPATYRWRVWSVGAHGDTKISPWSLLKIAAQ